MTAMRTAQENAEENDKRIVDWELQITALNRRLTLLVSYSDMPEKTLSETVSTDISWKGGKCGNMTFFVQNRRLGGLIPAYHCISIPYFYQFLVRKFLFASLSTVFVTRSKGL